MKKYLFTALLLINSPVIADTTMTNNDVSQDHHEIDKSYNDNTKDNAKR